MRSELFYSSYSRPQRCEQLVHAGVIAMQRSRRIVMSTVCSSLVVGWLQGCASQAAQVESQSVAPDDSLTAPLPRQSTQELEQLVAPIALYPDPLVAQILAGATHPTEVVEADRWLQQHPDLKGEALATAVDAQSWDPRIARRPLSRVPLLSDPDVVAATDRLRRLPWDGWRRPESAQPTDPGTARWGRPAAPALESTAAAAER